MTGILAAALPAIGAPSSQEEELAQLLEPLSMGDLEVLLRAGDAPDLSCDLGRLWRFAQEFVERSLNERPGASAGEVAAAFSALEPLRGGHAGFEMTAIPLGSSAVAVALEGGWIGTAFVVARQPGGAHRVAWDVKDVAAREPGWTGEELPAWGDDVACRIHGPLTGGLIELPPSASGAPRFALQAGYATLARGTFPRQLSIWEWDGHTSRCLWAESYWVSFDTEPLRQLPGGLVEIPVKGVFEVLSTCGACPEPRATRRLRLGPHGVESLGARSGDPELAAADALIARVLAGRTAEDLASAGAVASLSRLLGELGLMDGERWLGMVMGYDREATRRGAKLMLATDSLPCTTFELESGRPYVVRVTPVPSALARALCFSADADAGDADAPRPAPEPSGR